MSIETTMSFSHIKYLNNPILWAQIYCRNSGFLDISCIPVCDRFEILENQMQSVAPNAVHPEKVSMELHGAQAVGTTAFGRTPPFFYQASHVCVTEGQ